jgi:DNA-binding IclR family transcriptional regulator
MTRSSNSANPSVHVSSEHVFEALRLISKADHPVGVTEAANTLGVPVTSARRALVTLENVEAVARSYNSSGYQRGVLIDELLNTIFGYYAIRDVGLPFLQRLALMTGQTASLGVSIGWYGVRIAAVEGWKPLRVAGIGKVAPINVGASGRVRLAFLSDDEIEDYLREGHKEALTEVTMIEPKALRADIAQIRKDGYCIDVGGVYSNVTGIAYPICDPDGRAIASITLDGPSFQFQPKPGTPEIELWRAITYELRDLIHLDPEKYKSPFSDLAPNQIKLDVT